MNNAHICVELSSIESLSAVQPMVITGTFQSPHPYTSLKENSIIKWCPLSEAMMELTFRTRVVISKLDILCDCSMDCSSRRPRLFTVNYTSLPLYTSTFESEGDFWPVPESVETMDPMVNI